VHPNDAASKITVSFFEFFELDVQINFSLKFKIYLEKCIYLEKIFVDKIVPVAICDDLEPF